MTPDKDISRAKYKFKYNFIMKRVKMAIMALSAITSIGSAFAFSPATKHNATTYYALKTGQKTFRWTTQQPNALSCQSTVATAVCTIATTTPPQDNKVPAAHASEIDNTVYR
jgi:hypothetical protein